MTKEELIKELEKFRNDEEVTILLQDTKGNDYISGIKKVSFTKDFDNERYEILLVPEC